MDKSKKTNSVNNGSQTIAAICAVLMLCCSISTAATLQQDLESEVQNMLDAGHLKPGYFVAGLINTSMYQFHGDRMNYYWHNPSDTVYTLLLALPHLPSGMQAATRTYIQNEFTNYLPTSITHVGWAAGTSRDPFIWPDEFLNAFPGLGPQSYNYTFPYWNFCPFNFYACAKYAAEFGGASTIFNNIKDQYTAPPSDADLLNFPHVLNIFIAGHIGYLELEALAGQPPTTSIENTLAHLKSLRLQHLQTNDPSTLDGLQAGGFIYVVPELADYLNQNAYSEVQNVIAVYNDIMPYWFVAWAPEQIRHTKPNGKTAEGAMSHLYTYHSLFSAKALILKESQAELEKYIDVPACAIGDLFYIQNLVYAIEAGGAGNQAPSVDAGANQTITLPDDDVDLDGTVTDDGLPSPPATVTQTWTKQSGPGTVTFGNANAVDTGATFSTDGVYVLRLTASDSELSNYDEVTVTVNPSGPTNQAPNVDAGSNQSITLPDDDVNLDGTISDDALPNPPATVTQTWTKESGPGTVNFANANAVDTSATFSTDGVYVLRLTADDSALQAYDEVTITVNPASGTGAFQQDSGTDGIVSMEAENFDTNTSQGGHDWTLVTTPPDYSRTGLMEATPNSGALINSEYVTNSPHLEFQVDFVKTGTHYIWIRGLGPTGGDNSVHAGLDGQALLTCDRISPFPSSWTWFQLTMGGPVATCDVPSTGTHTVDIWMREDGFCMDKIVLTVNSSYTPTGYGPAESPRAGGAPDTDPPTPDPLTWATVPYSTGTTSISMTAATASDPCGVEYFFDCTAGGGNDSGWQDSTTYEDTGLSPSTQYTYRVQARDKSTNQNAGGWSTSESATTDTPADTTPPTPDPLTWATLPHSTGTTSISMTATTASDPSGVEYFFDCTAGGGHDSGWQDSTTYEDTALSPDTQYTYRVQARDKSVNQNTGGWSTSESATTDVQPDTTPPTPDPLTWASVPAATGSSSIAMTATTASDPSGVEYYFECTAGGGNDSVWQAGPTYEDTGLDPNTQYTYRIKARDLSASHNETAWSTSESATTDAGGDILDSLILRYEFDEAAGSVASDSSGNNNDGTLNNFPTDDSQWVGGKVGNALQFDGTDDWVDILDSVLADFHEKTISVWVKTNSIQKGDIFGTQSTYRVYLQNRDGDFYGGRIGSSDFFGPASLTAGQWHHIALVIRDAGVGLVDGEVYVDGNSTGSTTGQAAHSGNLSGANIGSYDEGLSDFLNASLDDFRIYDRVLTPAEIQSVINNTGGGSDTDPPTPDPLTWATVPYSTGTTSISMTATTASDPSGVEYYFECTAGGGNDSGWQDSTAYEDTGLSPSTQYTYRVQARDKSANQNTGGWSTSESATTDTPPDMTPPTPDPLTWVTVPYATGTTSISMTATTASDPSGVEYYFECTAGGGHNSGWQAGTTYEDTELSPDTQYTYRVKAHDLSANQNETAWSTAESATTDAGGAEHIVYDGVLQNGWALAGGLSETTFQSQSVLDASGGDWSWHQITAASGQDVSALNYFEYEVYFDSAGTGSMIEWHLIAPTGQEWNSTYQFKSPCEVDSNPVSLAQTLTLDTWHTVSFDMSAKSWWSTDSGSIQYIKWQWPSSCTAYIRSVRFVE